MHVAAECADALARSRNASQKACSCGCTQSRYSYPGSVQGHDHFPNWGVSPMSGRHSREWLVWVAAGYLLDAWRSSNTRWLIDQIGDSHQQRYQCQFLVHALRSSYIPKSYPWTLVLDLDRAPAMNLVTDPRRALNTKMPSFQKT